MTASLSQDDGDGAAFCFALCLPLLSKSPWTPKCSHGPLATTREMRQTRQASVIRRSMSRRDVSISGSVATYLIGGTERRMLMHDRFCCTTRVDCTSLSCCLIRSKTQPIEKCSYRPLEARAADVSMTHSSYSWPKSAHLHASECEHSAIGYVLLLVDNKERSLSNGEDSTDQTRWERS